MAMREVLVLTSDCILTITLSSGSGTLRLNFLKNEQQNYSVHFSDDSTRTITVWYDTLSEIKLGENTYYPVKKLIIDGIVILGDSEVFIGELESEFKWFSIERFTKNLPASITKIEVSNIPSIRVFVGV